MLPKQSLKQNMPKLALQLWEIQFIKVKKLKMCLWCKVPEAKVKNRCDENSTIALGVIGY